MEQKPVSARRTKQQILELLEQFEQACTSMVTFCNRHQISPDIFHKWKRRFKTTADKIITSPGFAPIEDISDTQPSVLFAEVESIGIYQPVTASYHKELIV